MSLLVPSLRSQARRFVAPALAILLGVAFVVATLVLSATVTASASESIAGDYGRYAAVATPSESAGEASLSPGSLTAVEALPLVESVHAARSGFGRIVSGGGQFVSFSTPPAAGGPAELTDGRMPDHPGEVALSRAAAQSTGRGVGDELTVDAMPVTAEDGRTVVTDGGRATVVGIVDTSDDARFGANTPVVFAAADQVAAWTGDDGWTELDVVAAPGATADAVAAQVGGALGEQATVRTGADQADVVVADVTGGTNYLAVVLLGFGLIAVFVSVLVIANTFAILLARRARETALLRAVGATRAQVVRLALGEALALGVVSSVVGVLGGILTARGLTALVAGLDVGIPVTAFTVPATAVLAGLGVGVAVALLSSLLPVWRSSRIAPVAALRPDAALTARSAAGVVRVVGGTVLAALGVVGLWLGATQGSLPAGIAGGVVSFVGVLMLGTLLVPATTRVLGTVVARVGGAPGELAVENAVRNPRRASATASALLVSVTLIAMMAVGTATAKGSVDAILDEQFPVDVSVTASAQPLPTATTDRLADTEGIASAVDLTRAVVTVGDTGEQEVLGLPEGASGTFRDAKALSALAPGTLVVSPSAADASGLTAGERVAVGDTELTVAVSEGLRTDWATTSDDLAASGPVTPAGVWLRIADSADTDSVLASLREQLASVDGASLGGAAPARAQIMAALDIMLAVVTALLLLAVVIAVIGIGNTLSLSVLERTRESALLRAIGLTRRQLRLMLGTEAALLALVAAVLGTLLGIGYAYAGVQTVLGAAGQATLGIPRAQLALIGAAALAAGVGASVLPARRATKVTPAAALAVE